MMDEASTCQFVPKEDPLSLSLSDMQKDAAVNAEGALVAAKRAVQGFHGLPPDVTQTFLYTGNALNSGLILPAFLSQGMGKSAAAHLIATAAQAYGPKGYRYVVSFFRPRALLTYILASTTLTSDGRVAVLPIRSVG